MYSWVVGTAENTLGTPRQVCWSNTLDNRQQWWELLEHVDVSNHRFGTGKEWSCWIFNGHVELAFNGHVELVFYTTTASPHLRNRLFNESVRWCGSAITLNKSTMAYHRARLPGTPSTLSGASEYSGTEASMLTPKSNVSVASILPTEASLYRPRAVPPLLCTRRRVIAVTASVTSSNNNRKHIHQLTIRIPHQVVHTSQQCLLQVAVSKDRLKHLLNLQVQHAEEEVNTETETGNYYTFGIYFAHV